MLFRKALWAAGILSAALLAAPASRAQGEYLDVYIAKVKPEKVAAAEAIMKKMAEANRRNHGDPFLTADTLYGDIGTYIFVSPRQDYADVDKGSAAFVAALVKAFGQAGADKLEADFLACLNSAHTEIRHRRPDLSRKMPADLAAYAKLIAGSRVLRTTAVLVRPGRSPEFDAMLREAKVAAEKNAEAQPLFVSQLSDGGSGGTYFLSSLRPSLAGFDKNPTLKDIVGEETFAKLQKTIAEVVESGNTTIYHYRPDLSNPLQPIADADPAFWNPKPAPAPKPKAAKP
jgi:hypothetical protein